MDQLVDDNQSPGDQPQPPYLEPDREDRGNTCHHQQDEHEGEGARPIKGQEPVARPIEHEAHPHS